MSDTVVFELVSPERLLMSEPVEMVVVPGVEGDFGVLPGHAPFISTVRTGVSSIWHEGSVARRIFVAGGCAEGNPESCTVLAEEAISLEEADPQAAEARITAGRDELEYAEDEPTRAAAHKRIAIAEALREAIRAKAA